MQGGRRLHVRFLLTPWLLHSKLVAVVLLSRDTNVRREEATCKIPAYLVAVFLLINSKSLKSHTLTVIEAYNYPLSSITYQTK